MKLRTLTEQDIAGMGLTFELNVELRVGRCR
jgi:hypothetical protein